LEGIFLSIGSNLGNRAGHITSGIEKIKLIPNLVLHFISPLYETEPVDGASGESFYNCAVECGYDEEPLDLLEHLEAIERREGRKSKGDYAARPLDIDIIFFGNMIIDSRRLTIPHPRLYKRRFVLVPLADLDKDFRCPKTGKTIQQLLSEISDTANIVHVRKELKIN